MCINGSGNDTNHARNFPKAHPSQLPAGRSPSHRAAGSRFEQLKGLVEVSQVIPCTRHAAPEIATLELKDMMLTVLHRNGASCYLAGLSKVESRKATLQFARLLEFLVPEEDTRERLLEGAIALRDLPEVEARVLSHIAEATANSARPLSPRARGILNERKNA